MNEEQITVSEEEIEQLITLSQEDNSEQLVTVAEETVSGGGTKDYNKLNNKPQINDVELIGNKSFEDFGAESLTNIEIENIINSIV